MEQYKMWITYGDQGWSNEFTVFEGEELSDVVEEIQNEWSEHIGSTIPNFDPELYDMGVDKIGDQ